ncbi:2-oxoglutarate ferredoxin oxidoreductase subunit gamma [Clostridia bacterium]|nr:2-oxoglutarate ferredoxin oxidoreductase subunit gamma [Clostridia bacterium]
MTIQKLIIAGFGGQGVMLIGELIAYAAMLEGKEVTWMPAYGPEMRGGTANCSVVVSSRPIASPVVDEPTAVVVMNTPSLEKFEELLVPGGELFINSSLIRRKAVRSDVHVNYIDCNEIAIRSQTDKAANMVMLGAILSRTNVASPASAETAMKALFSGKKAAMIPSNMKALSAWKDLAKSSA